MWPFSRKTRDIASLPAMTDEDHPWGILQYVSDGSPLIVRYNESAKDWVAHPDLSIKLGFAVPLNSPQENGLPDPTENEQLNDVEDIIVQEVAKRTVGFHALVLTTGTMKEFVFYIPEGADIETIHETIQHNVPTHEVQCMTVTEPRWDSYRNFIPS